MKALEIIEAMTYDSSLAEHAQVHEYDPNEGTVGDWIAATFGNLHVKSGDVRGGHYLAVWSCHGNDIYPFNAHHEPDVILERDVPVEDEDDNEVWLWEIDR